MQLSEALFANTTLRNLDVTLNDIEGEGKDALLDAIDFSFVWCVPMLHVTQRCLMLVILLVTTLLKARTCAVADRIMRLILLSRSEPTPTSHRLAIAMALHPRLGEESPLWQIARPFLCGMKKTIKAGKKPTIREKVIHVTCLSYSVPSIVLPQAVCELGCKALYMDSLVKSIQARRHKFGPETTLPEDTVWRLTNLPGRLPSWTRSVRALHPSFLVLIAGKESLLKLTAP